MRTRRSSEGTRWFAPDGVRSRATGLRLIPGRKFIHRRKATANQCYYLVFESHQNRTSTIIGNQIASICVNFRSFVGQM
jgi:hypothetical protein